MERPIRISVDAMGGDEGLDITVPASIKAILSNDNLHIILVGDKDQILHALVKYKMPTHERISIVHAEEVVGMDELPSKALRFKKHSSMRIAINLVKEGKAQACVSAGNTGALMATASFVLKTLPGIDRPAIIGTMPSLNKAGMFRLLDMGADIDVTPDVLAKYAIMGSVVAKLVSNIENPVVALLNVGAEDIKGSSIVKRASNIISRLKDINYVGYIEGDGLFSKDVDVVVCDGFPGNVALKTAEGTAKMFLKILKQVFTDSFYAKIIALLCKPLFNRMRDKFKPDNYNGASFIGLKGIVIKSHGGTSVRGFQAAVRIAMKEVVYNVPELIESEVKKYISIIEEQNGD